MTTDVSLHHATPDSAMPVTFQPLPLDRYVAWMQVCMTAKPEDIQPRVSATSGLTEEQHLMVYQIETSMSRQGINFDLPAN